jgi:hypothetical protein
MHKKKILFVVGSLNQTTQMHQISRFLDTEFDCYFTQFYPSGDFANWLVKKGFFDNTIWGGKFKADSEAYLRKNHLKIDYKAINHTYDLAILCTDMYIPENIRGIKKIWVQEGMIDPINWMTSFAKKFDLPRYLPLNTSLNGTSNQCDIFFSASEGYTDYFAQWGTERKKIVTIGIPNYDNAAQYLQNDFPYKGHVMVATSDIRETYKAENRPKFLLECANIANGRRLIFKLHPNEVVERAVQEIKDYCPEDTLVYTDGNINHMIANCEELITQYSTVVYTGIALGKKIHSFFPENELYAKTPIQNGGTSARIIAEVASMFVNSKKSRKHFVEHLPTLIVQIQQLIKIEELAESVD